MAAPSAPAGFAVAVGHQSRPDVGACSVTSIGYAALTWTSTALGAAFKRYEIQRSDDAGATWTLVATLISETIAAWADYEAARGVSVKYRLRVVNAGSEVSTWAGPVTVTVPAVNCEWLFVSNLRPDLNVGAQVRPDREYRFPTTGEIVVKELWGRDFHATFRPLEQRGVIVALSITAAIATTGATPGVRAFDALRAMFEEPSLPYVATLDPYGNRFLSTVQMVTGHETQPGDRYYADLTVIQITTTIYAPLVSTSLTWRNSHVWRGAQTWRGVV